MNQPGDTSVSEVITLSVTLYRFRAPSMVVRLSWTSQSGPSDLLSTYLPQPPAPPTVATVSLTPFPVLDSTPP